MPTRISKPPKEIEERFRIKLLGEPYTEMKEEDGALVMTQGYIFKGKKYPDCSIKVGNKREEKE